MQTEATPWFDDHHKHASAMVFLLARDGRLILQLRDDLPNIDNPGRITAFGGGAEHHETPIVCALRELEEETGIQAKPEDLQRLGALSRVNPRLGDPLASVFFLLRDVDPDSLVITEGRAVILTFAEVAADPRTTDMCKYYAGRIAQIASKAS